MKYAMNTLKIELFKQIEAVRVVKRLSAYPEHQAVSMSFERNATELQKAIEFLQSAEPGESPATDRQHTQAKMPSLQEFEQWSLNEQKSFITCKEIHAYFARHFGCA